MHPKNSPEVHPMPKTIQTKPVPSTPPQPVNRSPSRLLQPFCQHCGSSRCRDAEAHTRAH
jgi:hypothetical protein